MKKLNKRNVLEFARKIYEEKGGEIYYRPLCHGVLAKKNGMFVGCILGDMYEEFVGKPVARSLTKREQAGFDGTIQSQKIINSGMKPLITERGIIKLLINRAAIKFDRHDNYCIVHNKLWNLPTINDMIKGESESARIKRARFARTELEDMAEHLE